MDVQSILFPKYFIMNRSSMIFQPRSLGTVFTTSTGAVWAALVIVSDTRRFQWEPMVDWAPSGF